MRTRVWFGGKDLRLADHAPLAAGEVLPVVVRDPYFFAPQSEIRHALDPRALGARVRQR